MTLRDKTVNAVGWSAIDNMSYIFVTFIIGIILARLLSPDDFGLVGLLSIITIVCNALIDGGFTSALVRKIDVTQEDYDTAFTINLVVSIFLYFVFFFSSHYIADFFSREELSMLIKVSSLELIIGALAIIQKAQMTRNINFRSQAKITLISCLVSGSVGITLAFMGFGVWAIVFQILTKTSTQTILFFLVNRWIPSISISPKSFHSLFGYGWKVMLNNCFNSIWSELFQFVIGKCYSPATLGQFTRSKQFSFIFSSNLTNVVQRVSFPVLSSIQDDNARMVNAYRRIIRTTMFATAISMLFLASISEPLIFCLIGPKWHEASIYLPLLCISGSTYPLQAMNQNMLLVQGRSDLLLKLGILQKVIGTFPLLVGVFVGIIPMLVTNIVGWIIMFFFNSHYSGRMIEYGTLKQLKDVLPSYIIAIIMVTSVYFLKYLPCSYWIILPLQIIIGLSVLLIVCEQYRIFEYMEIKKIVANYVNRLIL